MNVYRCTADKTKMNRANHSGKTRPRAITQSGGGKHSRTEGKGVCDEGRMEGSET